MMTTTPSNTLEDEVEAERRERLLGDLRTLHEKLRRSNRPPDFSAIRDEHPEVAEMLFCGRDLRSTDLHGADLRDIDFRGSDLSECDFSGAWISGARFEMAKVARAALMQTNDWREYRDGWIALANQPEPPKFRWAKFRRRPGELFAVSPLLPEMVIVEPLQIAEPEHIELEERTCLNAGRLAIAARCVTNWEFVRVIASESAGARDDQAVSWPSYAAHSYCAKVTSDAESFGIPPGSTVRLPSYALFHALASWRANDEDGTSGLTDLTPADLELGVRGREFVQLYQEAAPTETAAAEAQGSSRSPGPPLRGHQIRALFRPVFLLGEN